MEGRRRQKRGERWDEPADARVCTNIHIHIYVYISIAGIRHPINLLLANRLANYERMLAQANKRASIY